MSQLEADKELATHFAVLHDRLRSDVDKASALQRLVDLAVRAIPSCDSAAITQWPLGRSPQSLAASDQTATQWDQLQYDLGEGPCLTAAADNEAVQLLDFANDERWPRFAAEALGRTPLRGVMAFHISDDPHRAALNLYSRTTDAFDEDALNLAALFVAHARVLMMHAAVADKNARLENALITSRLIGAAVGILMNAHRITGEEAFDLLRRTSQNLNRKLRDIADDVTQTGTLPS